MSAYAEKRSQEYPKSSRDRWADCVEEYVDEEGVSRKRKVNVVEDDHVLQARAELEHNPEFMNIFAPMMYGRSRSSKPSQKALVLLCHCVCERHEGERDPLPRSHVYPLIVNDRTQDVCKECFTREV